MTEYVYVARWMDGRMEHYDDSERIVERLDTGLAVLRALDSGAAVSRHTREEAEGLVRGGEPVRASYPTAAQVNSVCMSYRHDFGLLGAIERGALRLEALEWLRAWRKAFGSDLPAPPQQEEEKQ